MSVSKLFIILAIFVSLVSCQKDEEACESNNCLGSHALTLTNESKSMVVTKDTTFRFASNIDTLQLKFVETYNTVYTQTATCECPDKNTALYGEAKYGRYKFLGKNLAMYYLGAAGYPDKLGYDLVFADTNMILHGANSANYSLFRNYDLNNKIINMDSLQLNGKYYYKIINSYDVVSTLPHLVTDCFFSKKTGLVKFTLDSVSYQILH